MGVDEVVVAGALACPRLHHAVREGTELGGQLLLGQALVRTRVDMADQDTGRQFDRGGRAPVVARVKISTSTLIAARRLASSTM